MRRSELNQRIYRAALPQRLLRLVARVATASGRVRPGVTVIIVNWNSERFLRVAVDQIRVKSDEDTRIIVLDNDSQDESRSYLKSRADVRSIMLPRNVGHELALDIGFLLARTEYVVALDVDAFPTSDRWLSILIDALDAGAAVAGAHVRGGFIHPCCLCMRLVDFVKRKHSFTARRGQRWSESADDVTAMGWDTGWSISLRERNRFLVDRTEVIGPGDLGSTFGDLIYHNFYGTRPFSTRVGLSADERGWGINADSAADVWRLGLERHGVA